MLLLQKPHIKSKHWWNIYSRIFRNTSKCHLTIHTQFFLTHIHKRCVDVVCAALHSWYCKIRPVLVHCKQWNIHENLLLINKKINLLVWLFLIQSKFSVCVLRWKVISCVTYAAKHVGICFCSCCRIAVLLCSLRVEVLGSVLSDSVESNQN